MQVNIVYGNVTTVATVVTYTDTEVVIWMPASDECCISSGYVILPRKDDIMTVSMTETTERIGEGQLTKWLFA